MTKRTDAEREEASYEMWVMGGGRERGEAEHLEMAKWALADLTYNHGYRVIETSMHKEPCWDEFPLLRAVIYKNEEITIIKWHSGNKGWFSNNKTCRGSSRWVPEVDPLDDYDPDFDGQAAGDAGAKRNPSGE